MVAAAVGKQSQILDQVRRRPTITEKLSQLFLVRDKALHECRTNQGDARRRHDHR